jgi:hypothetical protein
LLIRRRRPPRVFARFRRLALEAIQMPGHQRVRYRPDTPVARLGAERTVFELLRAPLNRRRALNSLARERGESAQAFPVGIGQLFHRRSKRALRSRKRL